MALSKKKQLKLIQADRRKTLDERSLNGKGYWMDGHHEHYDRQYMVTGDEKWLEYLPDYRKHKS